MTKNISVWMFSAVFLLGLNLFAISDRTPSFPDMTNEALVCGPFKTLGGVSLKVGTDGSTGRWSTGLQSGNPILTGSFSKMYLAPLHGRGVPLKMYLQEGTGWFSRVKGLWRSEAKPGQHQFLLDLRSFKEREINLQDLTTGELVGCSVSSDCC